MIRILFLFLTLFSASTCAEKMEIKVDGKSIVLPYWAADNKQYGVVILIQGGEQPSWSSLLAQLAKKLASNGWSAVLLNCSPGVSTPWVKQLPSLVDTLRQQKSKKIIVLHNGQQLKNTMDYAMKPQVPGIIEGLALLSAYDIPQPSKQANAKSAEPAVEQHLPILDITGQFDYDLSIGQMLKRRKNLGKNNYTVVTIPGAHDDYQYSHELLYSFLHGWMLKLHEFQAAPAPIPLSYLESVTPYLAKAMAQEDNSDWEGFLDYSDEPHQPLELQINS